MNTDNSNNINNRNTNSSNNSNNNYYSNNTSNNNSNNSNNNYYNNNNYDNSTYNKTVNKKTKKKKAILPLTEILLVAAILSASANIFLLVTEHRRTQSTVARIEADDIADAKDSEKDEILNTIREQFEDGSSTLSVLKKLYPDNIVYVNKSGRYVFADINPALAKTEFNTAGFKLEDNGLMSYSDDKTATTYTGIDLSRYNSDIDFAKAKASGIDYAMIRCGYRAYGSGLLVKDTSFETYITNALKNNVDVGVYFYTQAVNKEEAVEEANYVLELIRPYNVTYPVAIDIEAIENDSFRQEKLSASELTDVVIAFCDTIKAAGYTPLIYSNLLYFMDNVELDRLEEYDKWFAGYQTAAPYYPYKYTMWQYTSTGTVPGVSGNVDINICLKNYKNR